MSPTEAQLISENATLRTAITIQALAFVMLCLIGVVKIMALAELRSGDHRRHVEAQPK